MNNWTAPLIVGLLGVEELRTLEWVLPRRASLSRVSHTIRTHIVTWSNVEIVATCLVPIRFSLEIFICQEERTDPDAKPRDLLNDLYFFFKLALKPCFNNRKNVRGANLNRIFSRISDKGGSSRKHGLLLARKSPAPSPVLCAHANC